MIETVCAFCKQPYTARRTTSKFCSDNCRVKFSRLGARMEKRYWSISKQLIQMWQLFEEYPLLADHLDQRLEWMQKEVAWMRLTMPQKIPPTPKSKKV